MTVHIFRTLSCFPAVGQCFRRSFTTTPGVPRKRVDVAARRNVELDGFYWFLGMLERHLPGVDFRLGPKKSSASVFIRLRDGKSRYDPDIMWQSLAVKSTQTATRVHTTIHGDFFRFWLQGRSSQQLGSGVILMCPPTKFMWILEPTPVRYININSSDGKYAANFLEPEDNVSIFRQRIHDLLDNDAILRRTWSDSLHDAMDSWRRRVRVNLLSTLVRLSPFHTLDFEPRAYDHSGTLCGSKVIIRTVSPLRRPGIECGMVRIARKDAGEGVPITVTSDFHFLLVLIPDFHTSELRRIGFLSKDVLDERGYLSDGSDQTGRVGLYIRGSGNFTGTALEGLEENFIDVDVSVEVLEEFVHRHLLVRNSPDGHDDSTSADKDEVKSIASS